MEGLIEGRIVHFVLPSGGHRPAIVVRICNLEDVCNLQVFTDGINDGPMYEKGMVWETSIPYSAIPRPSTWHWIEKIV